MQVRVIGSWADACRAKLKAGAHQAVHIPHRPAEMAMTTIGTQSHTTLPNIVLATGEEARFAAGDRVRVLDRSPVGHYRVPAYLRGRTATIETVIQKMGMNNEEEGYGRNAGNKRHYYRLALPMNEVWTHYAGSSVDSLRIEVFESWLERSQA
jgi:nitrile hydratase